MNADSKGESFSVSALIASTAAFNAVSLSSSVGSSKEGRPKSSGSSVSSTEIRLSVFSTVII